MFKWLKFFTELGGAYFDKNTSQDVKNSSQQQRSDTQQQFAGSQGTTSARSNEQYNAANERGTDIWNQYSGLASTGGISQTDRDRLLGLYHDPAQEPNTSAGATAGSSGVAGVAGNAGGIGRGINVSVPPTNPSSPQRQFQDAYPFTSGLAMNGGVDTNALRSTQSQYQNIANNANAEFDPTRQASITSDLGSLDKELGTYRGLQMNGGIDDASANRFRGGGVYDNLANTGGYNPEMRSEFLQRATSTVPAMYQNMADEIARRRNVQGGYAPGFSNSTGLLARQASQGINDATRNANLDLNNQIIQNKVAGAQGMTGSEHALQGLRTGNILAGTAGASNVVGQRTNAQMALEKQIQDIQQQNVNNKLAAIGGLTKSEQDAQQLAQQGKIAGAGFITSQGQSLTNQDIAEKNLQGQLAMAGGNNALANAQIRAAMLAQEGENQRFLIGGEQSGKFNALSGLSHLYDTNMEAGKNYSSQNLTGITGQAGSVNNLNNIELGAGKGLGIGGFINDISPALGMAGSLFTGIGGLPGMQKPPVDPNFGG